jgi:hypothetical protein
MTIKKIHAGLMFFTLLATALHTEIIFSENFDGVKDKTPLSELNWDVRAADSQSLWNIEDGYLKVTCFNNPYNGGFVEKEVPLVRKGVFEFDANIAMEGRENAQGIALTAEVYNISTWFHDYCGDWCRYFPEPPSKRLTGFRIEPVGHKSLTKVEKGKWNHYRIYFDADEGIVEYYCNDMKDPVSVDADVPVLGRAEYEGRHIRFASMGFVNGSVSYGIDNIVLATAQSTDAEKPSAENNNILVFQGISSNEYRVAEILKEKMGRYSIREYWLDVGLALTPKNRFKMERLPGRTTLDESRVIIFVDLPVEPGAVPEYFLKRLEGWVKNGGVLITLGGPYSYGKGGYKGTLLEVLLPVKIVGPWEVKKATNPLVIKPEKCLDRFAVQIKKDRPAVYYYHDLAVKGEAKILAGSEQNLPLWVYHDYGEGRVISFIGTVMGASRDNTVLLTEWSEWDSFFREVVNWSLTNTNAVNRRWTE